MKDTADPKIRPHLAYCHTLPSEAFCRSSNALSAFACISVPGATASIFASLPSFQSVVIFARIDWALSFRFPFESNICFFASLRILISGQYTSSSAFSSGICSFPSASYVLRRSCDIRVGISVLPASHLLILSRAFRVLRKAFQERFD